MHLNRALCLFGLACLALTFSPTPSYAILHFDAGTPYLSFADSPFASGSFAYFYLEDFEDHLLNVPGVTGDNGGVTSVVFGPSVHDSVDADDGAIDGSGLLGDSYFFGSGATGVTFTFNAGVLGALPDSAGVVWTDGSGTTSFEAFGPGMVSLGTIGPVAIANGSFNGETDEDRFFGISGVGPILAIRLSNSSGGIELDHLQYGLSGGSQPPPPTGDVPEPATAALALLGLATTIVRRRRQR